MRTQLVLLFVCAIVAAGPMWAEPPDLKPLSSPTLGAITAASAPALGAASLTVDQQIHLGTASDFFKDGAVFLWDDASGNTALGRDALTSAAGDATGNTAIGRQALQNATGGTISLEGSFNTAVGDRALESNTTGFRNTAVGWGALQNATAGTILFEGSNNTAVGYGALYASTTGAGNAAIGMNTLNSNDSGSFNTALGTVALYFNTTGKYNTGVGYHALVDNTTGSFNTGCGGFALRNNNGSRNVGLGYRAGYDATTGDDNIFIANEGEPEDADTIRIGTQGTQTQTFIAGIHSGSDLTGTDIKDVCVNDAGELGPCPSVSSQRFKEAIRDMGQASSGLLALRPVTFRYKPDAVEAPRPLEFGLIAEEVAELYPDLVTYDEEGLPYGVRYQVLIPMLLNELQKQHAEMEQRRTEMEALRRRLARLEKREKGIL